MEWSIFDPILAHRSFETMYPKGRSLYYLKWLMYRKRCILSEAKKGLQDISHHRRFSSQDVSHSSSIRFAPIETFRSPREDVSPPGKDVSPLSKLGHFEPLCETLRPHSYRTFRTLGKSFRPRYHRTFHTLEKTLRPSSYRTFRTPEKTFRPLHKLG